MAKERRLPNLLPLCGHGQRELLHAPFAPFPGRHPPAGCLCGRAGGVLCGRACAADCACAECAWACACVCACAVERRHSAPAAAGTSTSTSSSSNGASTSTGTSNQGTKKHRTPPPSPRRVPQQPGAAGRLVAAGERGQTRRPQPRRLGWAGPSPPHLTTRSTEQWWTGSAGDGGQCWSCASGTRGEPGQAANQCAVWARSLCCGWPSTLHCCSTSCWAPVDEACTPGCFSGRPPVAFWLWLLAPEIAQPHASYAAYPLPSNAVPSNSPPPPRARRLHCAAHG